MLPNLSFFIYDTVPKKRKTLPVKFPNSQNVKPAPVLTATYLSGFGWAGSSLLRSCGERRSPRCGEQAAHRAVSPAAEHALQSTWPSVNTATHGLRSGGCRALECRLIVVGPWV